MPRNIQSPRDHHPHESPNDPCHGYTGGVTDNGNEVVGTPKVFAIYWSDYISQTPLAAQMFDTFISTLITSPYMDGLFQYGINPGVFLGSMTVGSSQLSVSNPLDDGAIQSQLGSWIGSGQVPQPDTTHYDTLYVIVTPEGVIVDYDGLNSITDFAGYHNSFHFNQFLNAGKTNGFYAVIPLTLFTPDQSSPSDLVHPLTLVISHELVEAFTDRNGNGWYAGGGSSHCEIADICELQPSSTVFSWAVSHYWSNSDGTCIPAAPITNYLILDSNGQIENHGFPADAFTQIEAMPAVTVTLRNAAFTQDGGWIVIGTGNFYVANNIPQDCFEQIGTMVAQGQTLTNVVFPPDGGWLILCEGYYFASGMPQDAFEAIQQMYADGNTVLNVAFSPSGEWIVLGQGNNWLNSPNLELALFAGMAAFTNEGGTIQNIVFFPDWSLLVIGTNGDYQPVSVGFPDDVSVTLVDFAGGTSLPTNPVHMLGSSLANLVIGQPL